MLVMSLVGVPGRVVHREPDRLVDNPQAGGIVPEYRPVRPRGTGAEGRGSASRLLAAERVRTGAVRGRDGVQSGLLPHPGGRGAVVIMVTVTVTPIEGGDRYGQQDHRLQHADRARHRAEGILEQKGYFAPLTLTEQLQTQGHLATNRAADCDRDSPGIPD
jgi:hypothetical protein